MVLKIWENGGVNDGHDSTEAELSVEGRLNDMKLQLKVRWGVGTRYSMSMLNVAGDSSDE